MSRFEKIDKSLDLENLAKHNRNFDRAHADLSSLQQQVSAEQQARMTADNAHTSSTAAHPAERITYSGPVSGARNVKEAIDSQNQRINGIVGQTGNSNSEIVDARAGSDGVAHPVLKARLDRMERRQMEDRAQTTVLNRGMNIVNTTQASGTSVQVKGRTLVNILGSDGGCESLTNWAKTGSPELSSTIKKSGKGSFKFSASNTTCYLSRDFNNKLESSRQYVLGAWVYVESFTSGVVVVRLYEPGNLLTSRYTLNANTAIVGRWQFVSIKIPTTNTIIGNGFRLLCGLASTAQDQPTAVVYIDDIRLYEVSAADYAAIGTTIMGDAVDAYLPYVDGVKHLQGASVKKIGKNLLPPATKATRIRSVWTIEGPYKATQNRTGASQTMDFDMSLLPGSYTISFNTDIDMKHYVTSVDANGLETTIYQPTSVNPLTFTVPQNSVSVSIRFGNNYNGTFTLENWMLVHGGVDQLPASFERRIDQYANCPVPLASSIDRSIADSYDSTTRQVFRWWQTIKLDGSLSWTSVESHAGFKRVSIANYRTSVGAVTSTSDNTIACKFDGSIMSISTVATDRADQIGFQNVNPHLVMSVADAVSGWSATPNPNSNAIKALTNGWRASGNNGSVYNSWVSILTGTAPATNTEAYVSANKAPGWDAWATVDYVLATPVIEQLSGDLGGLSLDSGGNMVELLEGVVVREKATLFFTGGEYYINGSTSSKPEYRVNNIIAVDGGTVGEWYIMRRPSFHEELGWGYAKIPANAYDGSDVYVTYVVLDRYLYTSNSIDATLTYQSTLGGAVAQSTQDIAALKQHDGVQDWILAQYAARLLALEEA